MQLPLFPKSGFDQSVMTPVLLGVLVSWVATETFGWVFAGLVVPGYLAAVFLLDPAGGIIDVFEAVVTYVVARGVGEYMARTGITSRVFGRERFFLVVLLSILVRLVVEGFLLPKVAPHARWAFSIGLVVVPLTANACWKTGLAKGFLQNGVPTLLVYLLLRYLFIPYTNLSLEGFELATENVAASFLNSPQAYILLLTGAVLAAAANVKWGWDFNGILVPALIGLVVMEPIKLAATFAESVILLFTVMLVIKVTPLKRANIEGPRRTVLFFTVDYALRFAFAGILGRRLAGDDVVSLMGFGYLLPTLMAVKMSQRQSVALVFFPTLKVSIASFAVGTLIGFGAHYVDGVAKAPPAVVTRPMPDAPKDPARAALWGAGLALEVAPPPTDHVPPQASALADIVGAVISGKVLGPGEPMVESRIGAGAVIIRERFEKPDERFGLPTVITRALPAGGRVVLFVPAPSSEPYASYAAGRLVGAGMADAVVLSGIDDPKSSWMMQEADVLAHIIAGDSGRVVTLREGQFSLYGQGLDARVIAMAKAISGVNVEPRPSNAGALLVVPPPTVAGWMDAEAPANIVPDNLASATQLALFLDKQIPRGLADRQSLEDLMMLRKFALTPILGKAPFQTPRSLARVACDTAGYKLVENAPPPGGQRTIVVAPGKAARSVVVVVREGGAPVVLEAPHAGRQELRDFAVRTGFAMDAHAFILGLYTSAGHVYHADAFRSAHAATRESAPQTVLVREGIQSQGVVFIGGWGPGSEKTVALVNAGISRLGYVVQEKALDPQAREIAARTALGGTNMVAVTADSFALEASSLDEARAAQRAFGDKVPFVDGALGQAASDLWKLGLTSEVPDGIRGLALSAAQEQSVVARRQLSDAIAQGKIRAAFVRTDKGQFLLVAGKQGTNGFASAVTLHPQEIKPTDVVQRDNFAACEDVLAASGSCEARGP